MEINIRRKLSSRSEFRYARLLEGLLSFSGGLSRLWEHSDIIATYPLLCEFQQIYERIDGKLSRHSRLEIVDFASLYRKISKYKENDLLIATSYHGHPVAFFCTCAQFGIRLVVCHRTTSRLYREAFKQNGIASIDLDRITNSHQLFDALDHARAKGRYAVLLIDAPHVSRTRFNFLGYEVTVSRLVSLYARRSQSAVLPVIASVI
jgi:hypothetical protein